jgi:hypothetical protein
MLRMQEMAFPGFKFQTFSQGIFKGSPQTPLFMLGMSATHVAFGHCYPPLIYIIISQKGPFSKNAPPPPPHEKFLKKGPAELGF